MLHFEERTGVYTFVIDPRAIGEIEIFQVSETIKNRQGLIGQVVKFQAESGQVLRMIRKLCKVTADVVLL